jgi:hypothetical protein
MGQQHCNTGTITMIEIVTDEKLKEHGINMFGELRLPERDKWLMDMIEHTAGILAREFIIPQLCGPFGRLMP